MKGILSFIFSILAALLSVFSPISANADMFISSTFDTYTVIQDFSQAENFDTSKYPTVTGDYSLSLIQIAESEKGQLYVYVYRPSGAGAKNYATEIRLEMPVDGVETSPADYKLQLLSTSGTLDKYVVSGVSVRSDAVRYYTVVQLARAFDSTIDQAPEGDNTASTVAYSVGQTWTACYYGANVVYSCEDVEVIEVTGKFAGFVRYYGNALLAGNDVDAYSDYDSFFVAFNCDRAIDELLTAKVTASIQKNVSKWSVFIGIYSGNGTEYGTPTEKEFVVTKGQEHTFKTVGIAGDVYRYDEIQTIEEFNKTTGASLSTVEYKWVLRFFNAPVEVTENTFLGFGTKKQTFYSVKDVTILQLAFSSGGVSHIMGVVDNKQSGGNQPIDTQRANVPWWVWLIVALLVVMVVVLIVYFVKKRNEEYKKYKAYYKATAKRGAYKSVPKSKYKRRYRK